MIDRLPPHSIEAGQAVLGCCLMEPNTCIPACIERFGSDPTVFYDLRHGEIFKLLTQMYDARDGIDLITLQQKLKDRQLLESVGGITYLLQLSDCVNTTANLSYYADILAEKATLRRLISVATSIVSRTFNHEGDVESAVDRAEAEILAIRRDSSNRDFIAAKPLTKSAIDEIERIHNAQGALTGLATGFADLDRMTWGLQAGETTVISGFPSSGKTSLAMNIAEHVALALKKPVGVFSLEMGALALGIRMICSHSRVNLRAIMAKGARESDFPKMMAAAGQIANSLLFVSQISGLSVYELRARARRLHQEHQIALFVVDYIQLMNAAGNGKDPENRTKEMDAISHGLHDLFKELGCHGLVLSQITDEGKLRDSRAIGQDADGVWRLKPATEQEPNDDALPVKLEIIKQRNGPTGIVDLTFIKPYTRFESAARISDEDVPHDMPRRPYND